MTLPPGVAIRKASASDLPELGRLGALLLRMHYGFDRQRFMRPGSDVEDGYAWFLGTQLEDPDVLILVAESGGTVAGYVYAGIEPRNWKELREAAGFIHDLVVAESRRGQGLAAALLDAACRWMRERGAERVLLWTAPQNAAARRLFDRGGFRETMIEMTKELED